MPRLPLASHPTRDGWIEIIERTQKQREAPCPIPHGMGGLKSPAVGRLVQSSASHPTRDGWIEISSYQRAPTPRGSPIPHGMGGLK